MCQQHAIEMTTYRPGTAIRSIGIAPWRLLHKLRRDVQYRSRQRGVDRSIPRQSDRAGQVGPAQSKTVQADHVQPAIRRGDDATNLDPGAIQHETIDAGDPV